MTRVSCREIELKQPDGTSNPLWMQLIADDHLDSGPSNFVQELDKFSVVPDDRTPTVAHAVRIMVLSIAVPDQVANNMRAATNGPSMVGAIKSLWLGCPSAQQI